MFTQRGIVILANIFCQEKLGNLLLRPFPRTLQASTSDLGRKMKQMNALQRLSHIL